MNRLCWIIRAYLHMYSRCGWASWDMCASLHDDYVVSDPDGDWSPADAVDENMTYWGD